MLAEYRQAVKRAQGRAHKTGRPWYVINEPDDMTGFPYSITDEEGLYTFHFGSSYSAVLYCTDDEGGVV